uniref:Uncharacterized protein n=1 Tax=Rhizophora mucronata TaxID=61149 RepID=A0A2P2QPY6_RHIMU
MKPSSKPQRNSHARKRLKLCAIYNSRWELLTSYECWKP